ncbi:TniQ family protein [Aliiroseovarius sp. F47248L]|uniref:TniQ family protein n=1 Tax=Aliiroseovarius sp. F47248L TaxID=2926420 RepID=UPI001FF14CCC|nr:TniQ family protein [Aliiroseovarius sp. F47248L]MCK0138113.1 TniQ family protein [Aliiroseovarius sp. F47248L]
MLFPKVPFHAGETPMSWAARQAAFHTGGRVVPFLNDLGIPVADLARGKRKGVEKLCAMAGEDPASMIRNSIIAVGHRRFELCGQEFSAEFTTGVVTRFCPLCIDEDIDGCEDPGVAMRHRVRWRLAPFRTCPKHNLPMSDVRLGKWTDMIHELQAMLGAIAEQRAVARTCARRDPSPLQIYVDRRLDGATGTAWLDHQGIDQVCRAAEMLGGLMRFGAGQKAADMTEDMWDAAGRTGWSLLEKGPCEIRDVLAQTLTRCLRQNGHPSPRIAFGMLYGWLFASRLSKDPGPIREIVRDVIIEHVPLVPGQMLLGRPVKHPRLSSINSIAKAEGLHSKTLANVLRVAGLIGDDRKLKSARNVVTDYEKAKALIDTAKHAVPVTLVPDMLTTSRPVVAELIALGQLTRIQDHGQLQSKLGKAIDGRSIQRTRKFIEGVGEVVDAPPETHVHLAKAAEKCRVTLRAILEMLFNRYLQTVYRLAGADGFSALLISPADVMACIEDPPPNASDEIRFWMG